MNVSRLLHYPSMFGVIIGYLLVVAKSATPIEAVRKGDTLLLISLVTAPFLFRHLVRNLTRRNLRLGRADTTSRYAAYWVSICIWLLVPLAASALASGNTADAVVLGLFHVIIAALFGIGAAKSEAKRLAERSAEINSNAPRGSLGWSIYGIAIVCFFAALPWLATKGNNRGDANEQISLKEFRDSLQKHQNEGMDKMVKQLDTTGSYSRPVEEQYKRMELHDAYLDKLPDDQYKRFHEAFARVTKSLQLSSIETNRTAKALNDAGGVFDPENLTTGESINKRKRLLSEYEFANNTYKARIEGLRGLISRELKNAGGLTDAQQEGVVEKWYAKMHTDVLLALVELNEQFIAVGYATLKLLDETRTTRKMDDVGRPLFSTDAEVESYNSLLSQMEKATQSQEVLLRRLASIAKERQTK